MYTQSYLLLGNFIYIVHKIFAIYRRHRVHYLTVICLYYNYMAVVCIILCLCIYFAIKQHALIGHIFLHDFSFLAKAYMRI